MEEKEEGNEEEERKEGEQKEKATGPSVAGTDRVAAEEPAKTEKPPFRPENQSAASGAGLSAGKVVP